MATKNTPPPAKKKTARKKRASSAPLEGADQQVGRIRELLDQLQKPQPDLKAVSQLAGESAKLEQVFRKIRQSAEEFQDSTSESVRALTNLRKAAPSRRKKAVGDEVEEKKESVVTAIRRFAVGETEKKAPPAQDDLTPIFQLVCEGLIKAQKSLDEQSVKYLAQIPDPRIQPALYSIPSVKAETKIALTVGDDSNLIVKLFGTPQDKNRYSESSLSFDVVATPPPPDGLVPLPSFLVAGSQRDEVIRKATGAAEVRDDLRARAMVFLIPQKSDTPFLLILSGAPAGTPTEVFRLSLDPKDKPASFTINDAGTLLMLGDLAVALRNWEAAVRPPKTGS